MKDKRERNIHVHKILRVRYARENGFREINPSFLIFPLE